MKHTKGTLTAKKITVRGKHGTYQRSVMVRAGDAVKRAARTRMGKALGSALVAHATFHGGARAGAKLGTGGALVGMVGGHIAGAKANKALFQTRGHKRALLVEVADNGRGFQVQAAPPGGDGMINMTERLNSLGGTCQVASDPEKGTRVQFSAPLPKIFL